MPKQKPHLNAADIELLKQLFATKAEVEGLQNQISNLPTKDEFYTKMDEVVGELAKMREENTLLGGKVYDHEERIAALEVSV